MTRRNGHDIAALQQSGTRGGAGLPAGGAGGGPPGAPPPAPGPGSATGGGRAERTRPAVSGPVMSDARATIDDVARWAAAPMVGRAEELDRLLSHADRAAGGRSSAVLLAGDAGVGKTRLLDELAARATDRGVRVLVGHCVDLGDVGLPYLPFVDLLRPVASDPD